ncbi:MAG: Gfo/Idh/MocA family oxidoreductase [Chloroflexi bacterium]|nr:Gfo/Idh/MocA family oxidoreductase [Chloroflexota bacterium]
MGLNHARVYAELEEANLVAVADANQETVERVSRTYRAHGYTDYRQMLEREKLDLVTVAVPTRLHAQVAMDVLDAGVHALVEKPIAATVAEGERMIAHAHRLGKKLTIGHIERFNPAILELKQRLDDQQLGRIFQIHVRRVGAFPPRIEDVGVVVDLATHDLNIIEYLTGSQIQTVFAETERRIHAVHEDLVSGVMRLQNGIIGVLDINWLTPTKIRELTIVGERGMFLVNYLSQDLYFYENNFASGNWERLVAIGGVREGQMIKYQVRRIEPLKAELQSFIQAVETDAEPMVSGEEALRALTLAHKLIESGREHKLVVL